MTTEKLPFHRWLKRAFLVFRILRQQYPHDAGRDELTTEELAERLEMPPGIADQAIARLRELGCIEIASTSPAKTVWRFVPGSKMPPECELSR